MNTKLSVVAAVVLVGVGVVYYVKSRPGHMTISSEADLQIIEQTATNPKDKTSAPQIRNLQTAPRTPIVAKAEEQVSPACTEFFNELRGLSLDSAFKSGKPTLPLGQNCNNPPEALKAFQEQYLKECSHVASGILSKNAEERTQQLGGCFGAANFYRATITDYLSRDQEIKDINDPKVLADILTARLTNDPKTAAEAAERLLELEPNLPTVAKTAAFARFLDASSTAKGDSRNSAWNKVDDALSVAKKNNPKDASMVEMELTSLVLRNADPAITRNQIETYRETYPDVVDYLLSWMDYRSNNKEAAIDRLKTIQSRGSKDPRIPQTIVKVQNGEKEAFSVAITMPADVLAPQPNPPAAE